MKGWSVGFPARSLLSFCSPIPQLIMEQQDQQLEMVSGSIRILKNMSSRVGDELDEQAM